MWSTRGVCDHEFDMILYYTIPNRHSMWNSSHRCHLLRRGQGGGRGEGEDKVVDGFDTDRFDLVQLVPTEGPLEGLEVNYSPASR